MLSVDGDADAALEARVCKGWNKFRQLVPLLTDKNISLLMRGKLCRSLVHSGTLYGSETWPVKKENMLTLQCGIKVTGFTSLMCSELRDILGIDDN